MAHILQLRETDKDKWGPPQVYVRKRERDDAERLARIIFGFRTHSWSEGKREQSERLAKEAIEEVPSV